MSVFQSEIFRQRMVTVGGELDRWIRILGPLILVIFAFCYYGQYYRSGLNLGGEGGTNAVIAMRLMEGQRPIADTFLGYNVMWFYPIVWLFQVVGPDFNAMRIFFYALCLVTAILGFSIVRRVTGIGWLALGTGLLLIAIPGMLFRNYMGLLPVLNTFVLLHAFVFDSRSAVQRWLWTVAAGLVLGLTYLTRIDVGVFFTPIYAGTLLFMPFGEERGSGLRIALRSVGAIVVVAITALALHVPFYVDAKNRGFSENFVNQYRGIWGLIQYEGRKQIWDRVFPPKATEPKRLGGQDSRVRLDIRTVSDSPSGAVEADDAGTKPRPSPGDAFRQDSWHDAAFVLALYLPLVVSTGILLASAVALGIALVRRNRALKQDALIAGITLGAALTLFPQYFFFRPDVPHLAEFMVPFLIAMVCSGFLAVRWLWGSVGGRIVAVAFLLLCGVTELAFASHAYFRESSGSIEVKYKRTSEFTAENGVRALVRKRDLAGLEGLRDAVLQHSAPHEWVITYPYSPTVNFMTNRRSYLYNLYVDNATAPRNFDERAIREIREFRPAVIVIDDRAINKTDASRFSNWAARTLQFIQSEYVLVGGFRTKSVFARPDKVADSESAGHPAKDSAPAGGEAP